MNNVLIKKFFNFSSSNNGRKYYEEFLAPSVIYRDRILNVFIPTHAPNVNGEIVNPDFNSGNINISCYKPKKFYYDG
jgi:hypothetical protein